MKYIYSILFYLGFYSLLLAQQQNITYNVTPSSFNEDESITITINGNSIDEGQWGVTNNSLYLWAWSTNKSNQQKDCPTNGSWDNSGEANKLTYNTASDTYTIKMVPKDFYANTNLSKISFLVKAKDGNGDKKSQDIVLNVGKFLVTNASPTNGSLTFVQSGSSFNISYGTSIAANYVLKANGTTINTTNNVSQINIPYTVNGDADMQLTITNPADNATITSNFKFYPKPTVTSEAMPSYMRQGITHNPNDNTKVGLALYAPHKNFIHVIGSFNNWTLSSAYVMKRDTANPDLYWTEITGLTPQQIYTFQYRTDDGVKVADPYSTLVLSPDDDPWIPASTYPNLPTYPSGQQFDVSVIQTAKPAYNWTVTNFKKPNKDNLMVYEVLVRDFTTEKNWQSMIDKIPYIKSLNVNAIELLPVMEFDGNNSWGYNPGFHYALDKAYGTPEKFKEFIDKCHQNGIAVILDIALNHASGRSPLQRLWNIDNGSGYGEVAANNPYFNQTAKHTYSVFYDFNHQKPETQYYVDRVLEQWIKEYKVDGLRWDLTKGFTQNCSENDNACTDSYQADRVAILKKYSDYQWNYDTSSYIIFEHLGSDAEEKEWANYRLGEGKGVMMWDKLTNPYNQNTMGYASDSNFNRVNYALHGFDERRNIAFGESHDEERLMFKNLAYGNSNGTYNVKNLNTALKRQEAFGAVFLPLPGPKMIWQFGELGYEFSINRCENGTISEDCRTSPKPIAFELGYDKNTNRKQVHDTWAKILQLRLSNEVFNTKTFNIESGDLVPRIYIWNDNLPITTLKNVVIIANFDVVGKQTKPYFPFTGTWKNLMDDSNYSVTATDQNLWLEPGEFRIFGNTSATLATQESGFKKVNLQILQNPVVNNTLKIKYDQAKNATINIYNIEGKLISNTKAKSNKGEESINLPQLTSGTYFIQLQSENGTAVSKFLVK